MILVEYDNARYYDSINGRFISPDPSGMAGGSNLYIYGNDDPINRSDYTGKDSILDDGGGSVLGGGGGSVLGDGGGAGDGLPTSYDGGSGDGIDTGIGSTDFDDGSSDTVSQPVASLPDTSSSDFYDDDASTAGAVDLGTPDQFSSLFDGYSSTDISLDDAPTPSDAELDDLDLSGLGDDDFDAAMSAAFSDQDVSDPFADSSVGLSADLNNFDSDFGVGGSLGLAGTMGSDDLYDESSPFWSTLIGDNDDFGISNVSSATEMGGAFQAGGGLVGMIASSPAILTPPGALAFATSADNFQAGLQTWETGTPTSTFAATGISDLLQDTGVSSDTADLIGQLGSAGLSLGSGAYTAANLPELTAASNANWSAVGDVLGNLDYSLGMPSMGMAGVVPTNGNLTFLPVDNAVQDTITGYRAVSQTEWDQIQRTGEFSTLPNSSTPTGNAGKWFYGDQTSAEQFGSAMSQFENTPYGVVQAQLPRSSITYTQFGIDSSYGVTNGTGLFSEYPGLNGVEIRPITPP